MSMVAGVEARLHQSRMPCSTAVWISMPCWADLILRFCRSHPGSLETTFSRSLEVAGELMDDTLLTFMILSCIDTLAMHICWCVSPAAAALGAITA